jgi:hypothetical protein
VTRALALALMRQAREYLGAIGEDEASLHLQRAIDALSPSNSRAGAREPGLVTRRDMRLRF